MPSLWNFSSAKAVILLSNLCQIQIRTIDFHYHSTKVKRTTQEAKSWKKKSAYMFRIWSPASRREMVTWSLTLGYNLDKSSTTKSWSSAANSTPVGPPPTTTKCRILFIIIIFFETPLMNNKRSDTYQLDMGLSFGHELGIKVERGNNVLSFNWLIPSFFFFLRKTYINTSQ